MLKTYKLFNEWRGIKLYGETLTDALIRAKKLQRPDKFFDGHRIEDGGVIEIVGVKQTVDTSQSTRGGHPYEAVIIETSDGQYLEVCATEYKDRDIRGDRVA